MAIDAPIHTNEGNLGRVLNAGLPVLLVFWQRDCPQCMQMMPVLDRLAKSNTGRALVVKVNAAEEPGLVARYGIDRLPSVVFIKQAQPLATARGAADEQELAAWLTYLTTGGTQPAVPSGPGTPLVSGNGATAGPTPGGTQGTAAPSGASGQNKPVVLTDANFDQVIGQSKVPVMVDFWAVWCGPCKMIAPVVEQMAGEFAGRAVLAKLNVDENPGVSSRYGIMSIPTLLIFQNGKIVDRLIGAQPPQVLRQKLAQRVG